MILRVDPSLALPVYEQIREQVVRMVVSNTLEPGTRMPTIRQLASDLRLAKGTVAKAYALLEESKVLETRGHRGSFILALPTSPAVADSMVGLAEAADAFVIAAWQSGADLDSAKKVLERQWDRL